MDESRTSSRRTTCGFTLIELMIAVAIVAILTQIAYPAYTSQIRKGKRATAQAALMDIASKEQTYLLDRRQFTSDTTALGFSAPKEIEGAYTFSFDATPAYSPSGSPPAFRAIATPSAALQAKGEQTLAVNHLGVSEPVNAPGYWGK